MKVIYALRGDNRVNESVPFIAELLESCQTWPWKVAVERSPCLDAEWAEKTQTRY